jgi:alpha-L-fucosidase
MLYRKVAVIAVAALMAPTAVLISRTVHGADTPVPAPLTAAPQTPPPTETEKQRDARMAWWREAKFGMFIHWGVYSVPAGFYQDKPVRGIGEWIMNRGKIPVEEYAGYAREFNPQRFDATAWVRAAKAAGMKYIVITAKHHDGFAMYRSRASSYNIYDATPFKRDPLAELAAACKKEKMRLGFYYSQAQDWHHPGGAAAGGHWDKAQDGDMDRYLDEIAVPQVRELLTNYGPVAVLWWDTPVDMTPARAAKLMPLLALQPKIIANNRLGGGVKGDTDTPEQRIPATGIPGRDWETCMTMNDTWGYKRDDNNWKSTETLIRNLVDIASKGGNYLLNVGPTSLGEIPAPSIERLQQVGNWMRVNGEAIYGTTASPFARLTWGRATTKGRRTLYLHVFDWPKDGRLLAPGLRSKVKSATLLVGKKRLDTETTADGVAIRVPEKAPDAIASVVRLELAEPLKVDTPSGTVPADVKPGAVATPATNGTVTLVAPAAVIRGGTDSARLEDTYGPLTIGFWTHPQTTVSWRFKTNHAGTFEVIAEMAAVSAGAQFKVSVGDQSFAVTAPGTGDYGTFRTVSLGKLTLSAAGEYELLFTPDRANWKPINIRAVTLKPIP